MANVVLIVGGGAREHALAWKLAQSDKVSRIIVAPGNPGCESLQKVTLRPFFDIKNHDAIITLCREERVDMVVVGPEDPLAKGLVDDLKNVGISCFGPSQEAAQLESSKHFAKHFMARHGIPTAEGKSFTEVYAAKEYIKNAPFPAFVVKANGLAAGKGVIIASSQEEAFDAVNKILGENLFGAAGETIVVEELLKGEEISVLGFCDGETVALMPAAQDHKKLRDGDDGPNTGGMGAYCPCPQLDRKTLDFITKEIMVKTVEGMKQEGRPFVGVLYAGLMLTKNGAKVLEFNCRFGDPEAEVILPLLDCDLFLTMDACIKGILQSFTPRWNLNQYAVGVVMASKGYPIYSDTGTKILGLETNPVDTLSTLVFHAGTARKDDTLVTAGGRVLVVVSINERLDIAAEMALNRVRRIKFDGSQYRLDIAAKGIWRFLLRNTQTKYIDAGVNVAAGNHLVDLIKPLALSTLRPGAMGSLGGFGGLFDLKALKYNDPILVSGTDGVGTKLKVAQALKHHSTIGIDLVAMCVNDILAHGAEPLFFLDYYACGQLDVEEAKKVVAGISLGCREANCVLIGGETAEMPGMYSKGTYEVAGFAVGAVERALLLPQLNEIRVDDVVIGIASSGIHSNGFSLVNKCLTKNMMDYNCIAPFNPQNTLGLEFLMPTRIYVKAVLPLLQSSLIKAVAHITGGGLLENIPRVLPDNVCAELDALTWNIPPVFSWLQSKATILPEEMLRTFNCGIGMVLIVAPKNVEKILEHIRENQDDAWQIGQLMEIREGDKKVKVNNFMTSLQRSFPLPLQKIPNPNLLRQKKVAVLISGSGTNLQALIDSTQSVDSSCSYQIALVISNKPDAIGLKRAELFNIPTKVVNHKEYNSRVDFDRAIDKILLYHEIDFVCLAGFMRILSGEFVRRWHGRMINIHPSLLPSFKGAHAHKMVLEAGVRVSGCTVHFVVEEVDSGGIILQDSVPVEINDSVESLQERVKSVEHRLYPQAVELITSGKVVLNKENKVMWT